MGDYTNYIENLISELERNKKNYNFHNYKVSVIIPVCNSENYIYDCLRSIINQSLKEIEIIVIDDGSRDLSRSIITEFSKYDSRIRFIRQEYTGRSAVRNKGLEIANGEYISFVNSKDRVSLDYFERLYEAAIKNHADICFANAKTVYKYYEKSSITYKKEVIGETLEHKVKIANIIEKYNIWNKLYKKELIIDKKFTIGIDYEDAIWLPLVLKDANRVVAVPNINYYYRKDKISQKSQDNAYVEITNFFDKNSLVLTKKMRLLIKQQKEKCRNKKKLVLLKDLDSHYIINLCGLRLQIKHKCKFKYKEAFDYGLTKEKRSPQLIVSLTTFPKRIDTVHLTINTLLRQRLKPDKLVLWLAEEQFPKRERELPKKLLKLKDLGLSIEWCEDLKSYKKLIPSLKKYPEDIIVTADDDLYYEEDWLESLYNAYIKNPNNIYVRRATRLGITKEKFTPISNRKHFYTNYFNPSYKNMLLGGSGCLFPPHSLHQDIFNINKIKTLIPTQDDFYFWAMSVLNHKKIGIVKGFEADLYCIDGTQDCGLCKINKDNQSGISGYEACMRLNSAYPQLIEILNEENEQC